MTLEELKLPNIYPKTSAKQVDLFQNIAQDVQDNKKSFSISQILSIILVKYNTQIESRVDVLEDVKSWISEDPLVILAKVENNVKSYRI